ncbi:hypothetical protein AAFF_G00076580 [Aldrovandia affinis]|uniref:Uncharacterized protein n=1 Tax=Aldrovandia affinis TaxID=143900 RepID=A0AAD7WDT8_9TELE|nr:hypothetical protein AAFF_G00076580 [Aldrovandia affinis]
MAALCRSEAFYLGHTYCILRSGLLTKSIVLSQITVRVSGPGIWTGVWSLVTQVFVIYAAGAAGRFGGALWGAAGLQRWVNPFSHLGLPEYHALLKLCLDVLDLLQHGLELGVPGRGQVVVLRGVRFQVKEQRRVMVLEEGSFVTVLIWGGTAFYRTLKEFLGE